MALLLVGLGAALMLTNPWFTEVDDEVAIIDLASHPALQTVRRFLGGGGQHEHPPLSDLILHSWLQLTGGNVHLIRLPSVIFYLLGAAFLIGSARHLAGNRAGTYTLFLLLLWPYGFHYGRLAGWYAFSFMLASLLTVFYLRYIEAPSAKTWTPVLLCALGLVYTNYFAWALLACLGFDLLLRYGRDPRKWLLVSASGAILLLACAPILPAFIGELRGGAKPAGSISASVIGLYNLYCLFVSESVAPWFWWIGIAAALAIACVAVMTFICSRPAARRFLIYFAGLFMLMTFLQIGTTKRLLFISPWLILAVGTALATESHRSARRWLIVSLASIGAIGWYGIFARSLYSAPRWIEPWEQIARQAAEVADSGGAVIGNSPSFFFYLTYLLPHVGPEATAHFAGLLPETVRTPNVFTPEQWVKEGSPRHQTIALFDGLSFGAPGPSIDELRSSLDSRCKIVDKQRLIHDSGADWKRKYQPETGQRPWRIEITTYACPLP